MTNQMFFDSDCISSFLWVKEENLILDLYPGRIILPKDIYIELSNPSIPHIKNKIASLCNNGSILTTEVVLGTEAYEIFHELAISPPKGVKVIGKGEAAAIALAKVNNGILASNNLKDISKYIEKYNLTFTTTPDILVDAMTKGLIDENTGNQIWTSMLSKRRKLPTASFSDYLKMKNI
jgi:predicted nucleic acid-binding protein